jgi:Capsule polysaccharide biosynthesis protein
MSRIFIRSQYPYPTSAATLSAEIKPIVSSEQWARFESLLKTALSGLGHEVIEQQQHVSIADDLRDASFRIYAHKTRRDVDGDLFYKQMHLPELFTIDHLGWGADHSKMQGPPDLSGIDGSLAERFVASLRLKFLETGASKFPQPDRAGSLSLPPDYIFVPLQTPRDYVQVHHAPFPVLSFVHLVARWANESQQKIVFKLHPGLYCSSACDNEIINAVNRYAAAGGNIFCLDANVHDLIGGSRGVFTINSGVGFESLIHGKPVVTFGNCDYKWVTFRADADCLNEARAFVFGYTDELRQEANRFIYYYFFRHAFSIEAGHIAESNRRLIDYLSHEVGRRLVAGTCS